MIDEESMWWRVEGGFLVVWMVIHERSRGLYFECC